MTRAWRSPARTGNGHFETDGWFECAGSTATGRPWRLPVTLCRSLQAAHTRSCSRRCRRPRRRWRRRGHGHSSRCQRRHRGTPSGHARRHRSGCLAVVAADAVVPRVTRDAIGATAAAHAIVLWPAGQRVVAGPATRGPPRRPCRACRRPSRQTRHRGHPPPLMPSLPRPPLSRSLSPPPLTSVVSSWPVIRSSPSPPLRRSSPSQPTTRSALAAVAAGRSFCPGSDSRRPPRPQTSRRPSPANITSFAGVPVRTSLPSGRRSVLAGRARGIYLAMALGRTDLRLRRRTRTVRSRRSL